MDSYRNFDEALEILRPYATEYAGGFSNHAPMAAEALCALGRRDEVAPWVEQYRRALEPAPSTGEMISADDWRAALGRGRRVADWIAYFDNELADGSWQSVLDRWIARLAPGYAAAAMHGVIRTGHAARALSLGETPARLHELAAGLGYWASRFHALPERAGSGHLAPSRAIAELAIMPQHRSGGMLTDGLKDLEAFAPFRDAAALVDVSGAPSRFIADLTATFARVYLANASDMLRTIAFIHCVTGSSILRLIVPHVSDATAHLAMRYAWQSSAAMYAAFGAVAKPSSEVESAKISREVLIDRAVANGDEHAIKLTEACLREFDMNPDPVYLAAAEDVLTKL